MTWPPLTLRNIRGTAIKVPMTYVLGTSAQAVREAPLLLVDVETEQGVTGRAYQFCYTPAAAGAIQLFLDPEVSAHLLAATPTAHWLEYVDWANAILLEPLRIVDGCAVPNTTPGNGLEWNEALVKRYRM